MFIKINKITAVYLVFLMSLFLPACSKGSSSKKKTDKKSPEVLSAVINNEYPNKILITFNEPVKADDSSGFSVDASSKSAVNLSEVIAGSGTDKISLTVERDVTEGEIITLSYGGNGTVRDLKGNDLAEFTNMSVENSVSRFRITSAEVTDDNPCMIILKFSTDLKNQAINGFTLKVNGIPESIQDLDYNDNYINLYTDPECDCMFMDDCEISDYRTLTIEYDAAEGNITDTANNPLASFGPKKIIYYQNPPSFEGASVSDFSPDEISIMFDDHIILDDAAGFTIEINSVPVTITDFDFDSESIWFTIDTDVQEGDDVTIEYNNTAGNARTELGYPLPSFTSKDVKNFIGPPRFVEGYGTSVSYIRATFSEGLDNVTETGFIITVNGSSVTIISCSNYMGYPFIDFTIDSEIEYSDTITIEYDGTGTVTDLAGTSLASFGPEDITNNAIQDTTPPLFQNAFVEDPSPDEIVVFFNEEIQLTDETGFIIRVENTEVNINSASAGGNTVTFTLADGINEGESVTIEYDAGAGGDARDEKDNPLSSFAEKEVSNTIGSPVFIEGFTFGDFSDSHIFAVFNEPVDNSSLAGGGFTVKINNIDVTINSAFAVPIMGEPIVLFELDTDIEYGDSVTIEYDDTVGDVADTGGIALASFGPATITNDIEEDPEDTDPPLFYMAGIDSPDEIWVGFNEEITFTDETGFIVKAEGIEIAVNSISAGMWEREILLTLGSNINPGDFVTIEYDGTGTIEDTAGNPLAAFGPNSVRNALGTINFYYILTFPNGSNSTADTYVYLYDANYNLLTSDDDAGLRLFSRKQYPLLSGATYYIKVTDYYNTGGCYSITVDPLGAGISSNVPSENAGEPNDGFSDATTLTAGEVSDSCFSPTGESDYFIITAP